MLCSQQDIKIAIIIPCDQWAQPLMLIMIIVMTYPTAKHILSLTGNLIPTGK
jgi:hypothetical protein